MVIRKNLTMAALLEDSHSETIDLRIAPEQLMLELKEGFKEIGECIVSASYNAKCVVLNNDDKTMFECHCSKVHIDEFVDQKLSLSEVAKTGMAYALSLQTALFDSGLSGTFRIILSAQLPDPESGVGNICTVRFHKLRPHQTWLTENLEAYKQEALLVIDWENYPDDRSSVTQLIG